MKIINRILRRPIRNTNLGLCLSGGGALGFAHIGAIQSLEDHGIFPTHIVGSSMGAIVGALYAAGFSGSEMLQLIKDDKLYKVTKLMTFRPVFQKSGLSSHSILRSLIHELIPHNSFEQLSKNLSVCVSNLNKANWEIIDSGNELDKWLAASASIPGVFETVTVDDNFYVDGGLLNNMPAQALRGCCQTIIGVDVIPQKAPSHLNKPINTLVSSVRALQHQNSLEGRNICQFVIEPQAIVEFHEFSFDAYQAIYQHGYSSTTKFIVENPDILKFTN